MSGSAAVSLIDPRHIDSALDRIRQAEPVGDNPLKRLAWLRLLLAQSGVSPSTGALDLELSRALVDLIAENLSRLRQMAGAPSPEPTDIETALTAFRSDYSRENARLEAWSALYFYYVLVDFDLRWQDMANALGLDKRQLRRRTELGYRLLADAITVLELEARASNHQLWMHLKLPTPSYTTLFGVGEALAQGEKWLLDAEPPLAAGAPLALALTGPGGAGKTALAHALARRMVEAEHFADLAWLALNGSTGYAAACALVAAEVGLLHLLDGPFEELEAGLRVRLAATPTLIVIDGADLLDTPETVFARLGALAEPGRLLATMRRQPAAGAPLRALPVEPLPRAAMDELLFDIARLSGSKWLDHSLADETSLAAIYQAVGGNPLAGRLVANQLATLPLERALARIGELRTEAREKLFDRLFEDAWTAIGEDAQTAVLALLVLPPDGADWNDIRPVTGLEAARLDRALDELVASSFVSVEENRLRYILPPLARRFVEARGRQSPWREALGKVIRAADQRLHPDDIDAPPADLAQAISLFQQEAGLGELPADLDRQIARVAPSARRSGQWPAWRDLMITLADQLRPSGRDPRGLARALTELGVAQRWLGDHALARAALDEAVAVYGASGDFVGQAETLLEIGLLCETTGDRAGAFEAYGRAAEVIGRRRVTDLYRRALNGLASLALAALDGAEALKYLDAALDATDDPPDGLTLSNMGMAHLQLGEVDRALGCQQQALAIFADEDDQPRVARTHIRLGMVFHAANLPARAEAQLRQGLDLMRALGDALGQARALNNLGAVFSAGDQLDVALATWREALELQTRLNDRYGMAYTHYNLADLLWRLGEADKARIAMASAKELAEEMGIVELRERIEGHPARG